MARRTKSGPNGSAVGKGNGKPRAIAPGREIEVWPGVTCTVKLTPDGLFDVCVFDGRELGEEKVSPPLELTSSPGINSAVDNKRLFCHPFALPPGAVIRLRDRQRLLQTVQL
jgi:hypothetical protein